MPAVVDHLVYATPDLETTVERFERDLGVQAAPGGSHPGEGTRNALIALGPRAYLEILAPDPVQPEPSRPLWLGLHGLREPRLTAWAMKAEAGDLEALAERAGRAGIVLPGVVSGRRRRADGVLLHWRFTDPHELLGDGLVPFFIDWGDSQHPAAALAAVRPGASLRELRAEHPTPAPVTELLRALGVDLPMTKGPRPSLIAILETSKGLVELR